MPRPASIEKDTWRVFRIMAEFIEGFEAMADVGKAVTFFGSARSTPGTPDYELCVTTARKFAQAGFSIITGGGPGIMEAANKGAQEGGGLSVGVNIDLPHEQDPNAYIEKLINFRYFFVRKVMFLKYAHGAVFLPGGYGTLDELFETLTLVQTQKTAKVPIVIMGRDHYRDLLAWLENVLAKGDYISPDDLELYTVTDDPDEAVEYIRRRVDLMLEKGQDPTELVIERDRVVRR